MRVPGPWRSLAGAGGPAGGRLRPQEPHTGVGACAGGVRAVQAKLRGAYAQGGGVPVGGPQRAVEPAVGRKCCPGAEAGARRVGCGVHGREGQWQARGGACGPAGGRWPH